MGRKLSVIVLCFLSLLLLIAEKPQASTAQVERDGAYVQRNHRLYGISEGSLRPQDCGPRCTTRCSKTSHKKPCMLYCQKCCAKCLCVPPGTNGNKQVCPCYNNWKTKRGGPKCP
ncbi:hypothetical protein NMG60_11017099 [Bertholletia excelsa]